MSWTSAPYTFATRVAAAVAPVVVRGSGKLARSVHARRDAVDRLVHWAGAHRRAGAPLVWFHAPSVGEGLQARAVLDALREDPGMDGVQWAFTHFSPSAERLAERMPTDVAGYLPWDLPGNWRRVFDALRPSVLVCTKTEVWPNLAAEAERRGVPVVLTAATLPETSSRRSGPARWFLGPTWSRVHEVHAIGESDAAGFRALGVRADAVRVLGDPGIDSAAARVRGTDPGEPWLAPLLRDRPPTLVAGSTWEAGERVLVPAATRALEDVPELRIVIAPHEPAESHLHRLEQRLRDAGWRARRLGDVERDGEVGGANALVVDRVGVLAGLYRAADVAYVGGGFGTDGLHSVLEPAAAGAPILIGPSFRSSAAAIDLVEAGGARVTEGADAMAASIREWLVDGAARESASAVVTRYIDRHSGAAAACARAIGTLMRDTARG